MNFSKHQQIMFVLTTELSQFIENNLSGEPSFTYIYIQLAAQATGILIAGFVLWRINSYLSNKRKNERRRNNFFETNYSKNWRK